MIKTTHIYIEDFPQLVENIQAEFTRQTGKEPTDEIIEWFFSFIEEYDGRYVKLFKQDAGDWRDAILFLTDEGHVEFKLKWL